MDSEVGKGSAFRFHIFLGVKRGFLPPEERKTIGKGLIVTPRNEIFATVASALHNQLNWIHLDSLDKVATFEKEAIHMIIIDSSILPLVESSTLHQISDDSSRRNTKVILLKDSRPSQNVLEKEFQGALYKPLRPSMIDEIFSSLMSEKPSQPKVEQKPPEAIHYHELSLHVLLVEDNIINQKVNSNYDLY